MIKIFLKFITVWMLLMNCYANQPHIFTNTKSKISALNFDAFFHKFPEAKTAMGFFGKKFFSPDHSLQYYHASSYEFNKSGVIEFTLSQMHTKKLLRNFNLIKLYWPEPEMLFQVNFNTNGRLMIWLGNSHNRTLLQTSSSDFDKNKKYKFTVIWGNGKAVLYRNNIKTASTRYKWNLKPASGSYLLAATSSRKTPFVLDSCKIFNDKAQGEKILFPSFESGMKNNLNISRYGAILKASSENTSVKYGQPDYYRNELIDGEPSAWEFAPEDLKPWIEVAWPVPVSVNCAAIYYTRKYSGKITVMAYLNGKFVTLPVQKESSKDNWVYYDFSTINTSRFRLYFSEPPQMREVQCSGTYSFVPRAGICRGRKRDFAGQYRFDTKNLNETIKAGKKAVFNILLTPLIKPNENIVMLAELGNAGLDTKSDFKAAKTVWYPKIKSSEWDTGKTQTAQISFFIPKYIPSGKYPLRLTLVSKRKCYATSIAGMININNDNKPTSDSLSNTGQFPSCSIKTDNVGTKYIDINGEKVLPRMWYDDAKSFSVFSAYNSTGIRIWILGCHTNNATLISSPGNEERDYKKFCKINEYLIKRLLETDPNAYIILTEDLRAISAWWKANPDEVITAGKRIFGVSLASKKYRHWAVERLKNFLKWINTKSYSNRIIGVIPYYGDGGDNYTRGLKSIAGDNSKVARQTYEGWLCKKYGTLEKLRKAHNNPNATWKNAFPTRNELVSKSAYYIFQCPEKERKNIDYWEFHNFLNANFAGELCSAVKNASKGRLLTGIYYTYISHLFSYPYIAYQKHSGHCATEKVLNNPQVDMIFAWQNYQRRTMDSLPIPNVPVASLNLHDKLYIWEKDTRTYLGHRFADGCYSQKSTLEVFHRDWALSLLRNCGYVYKSFDERRRSAQAVSPWFMDDQLLSQIEQEQSYKPVRDRLTDKKIKRIAVLLDDKSAYYMDSWAGRSPMPYNLMERLMSEELTRVGAGFDIYYLSDLDKIPIDQYGLFIFTNSFKLDANTVEYIQNKLYKSAVSVLYLYAPGVIKNNKFDVVNISDLTGMKVKSSSGIMPREMKKVNGHTLKLKGFKTPWQWARDVFQRPLTPYFYIKKSNKLRTIGCFPDGKIAAASIKMDKANIYYSTFPFLDTKTIKSAAVDGGVFIFNSNENCFTAQGNGYILIQNPKGGKTQKIEIALPDNEYYLKSMSGKNCTTNEIKLKPGTFVMFSVCKK